ncbi:transporter substrate-binding domain-containing protein [Paraglaciecola sp. 20A4]|uniref:substrate-binding periplasmic protein n=1 Tax=Paraglaciecola sp. 20A4 TaxID=2687288 RepID=UPI001408B623|nr:transporter substrate-binding domain-containing protein [Paraglaciecola sp. 20A4]
MSIKPNLLQFALWGIILSVLACSKVQANKDKQTLEVAVGWSKPPYVNSTDDSGFELDLVRKIFSHMGYAFKPIYVPYGRSVDMLVRGHVDAALTLTKTLAGDQVQLTDNYIQYQNVAISLQSQNIAIKRPKDLNHFAIAAYQTASKNLGAEYALAAKQAPLYVELPDQKKQVAMLLGGHVSVVVMDVNIFNDLQAILEPAASRKAVTIHNIFAPNSYQVGFLKSELKNQFNQTLKDFLESPEYALLVKKYHIFDEHVDLTNL